MSIVMILGGGVLEKCWSREGRALMNGTSAFINQTDKDFPGGPVAKILRAGGLVSMLGQETRSYVLFNWDPMQSNE